MQPWKHVREVCVSPFPQEPGTRNTPTAAQETDGIHTARAAAPRKRDQGGAGCSKRQRRCVQSLNSNNPWFSSLLVFLPWQRYLHFPSWESVFRFPNFVSVLASVLLSHPYFPLGKFLSRPPLRFFFSPLKPCREGINSINYITDKSAISKE